jgi:hypothetical protein
VSEPDPLNGNAAPAVWAFDSRSAGRTLFVVCLCLELAFVLLDYQINYVRATSIGALRRLTNIAREDSLASWFSSAQTLLIGLTALGCWMASRAAHRPVWRRFGWLLVGVLFVYMAVDDGAQLHERFATAFDVWAGSSGGIIQRFPSYTWQVLFLPLLAAAGAASGLFLVRELGSRRATALLLVAFVLFGGAVVLDFFEGLERDHPWNVYAQLAQDPHLEEFTRARFRQTAYAAFGHFSRSLEEFCEMLASTCIWTAIVMRAGALFRDVRLQLVS